jgi:FAD:protein FMN transferase
MVNITAETAQRIEFRAMGCGMTAVLDAPGADARRHLDEVPGWFARWEQHLSRFLADSELSTLNRSSGHAVVCSPVLWSAVQSALDAEAATGGLVTPSVLPALEWAGYDRSFDPITKSRVQSPRSNVGSDIGLWTMDFGLPPVEMDSRARTIRLPRGVRLDLGGTGKGWAADRAVSLLAEHGPALVDAGGDIAVSGPMQSGEGWPIGVADPSDPGRLIETLQVREGGVATSGRDYRRWKQGGTWKHHIIDPRTGLPAETDLLSVTVVGRSALSAEAGAKAALILGSEKGLAWLDAQPALAGLLVLENGRVVRSKRIGNYLWS